MKKWILIISVLLLLLVAGTVWLYNATRAPLEAARQYAENRAAIEADIALINQFYMYNGSETYYVVIGEHSDDEQKMVVWIPEDEDKEIVIKNWADGISEQEAINKLLDEENPKEILNISLGMENDLPIWELSYLDNDSKLNYYLNRKAPK